MAGLRLSPAGEWYVGRSGITLHGRAAWVVHGDMLYTSRTGIGWTHRRLPCPAGAAVSLVAHDTRRLSLMCTGDAGAGSSGKLVYASGDGGRTFTFRGLAPLGGYAGTVVQPSRSRILIASSSAASFVYLSRDGGRTWRTTWRVADTGAGLREFAFVSSSQGAMVVNLPEGGALFLTRDGGTR